MSEAVATPANSVPRDGVAANIVKGIQNKASGRNPNAIPPADVEAGKGAPPVAVDPNAGKEKYVVNGVEKWLTPDQARAYVQKGIAFEPKMDELARLAQEQVQFQRALIDDPGKVLSGLARQANIPLKDLVARVLKGNTSDEIKETVGQWYYEHAVEPLKLSPEQLKAREDAKFRSERESADKVAADNAVRMANIQRVNQAMGVIKAQIAEAMKDSGLPSNDTPLGAEMAAMVAKAMQLAQRQRQALTPKQAIEYVKQRIKSVQSAYYETLEDEALVSALGENVVDKIKKHLLKLAKGAGGNPPNLPNGQKPRAQGERKTLSMDEFHDYLAERKKAG